jgi:hypothetical protein
LLDKRFSLAGLLGLDSLIGLVPAIGDSIGTPVSAWLVLAARRCGALRAIPLRMIADLRLDDLVGAIAAVGDISDFAFKANRRNLDLLRSGLAARR